MQWLKKHRWLLLALGVAVWAGRMLLTTHHFYVHDDIQVFRLNEFVHCLQSGQFPCRWSENLGKGYGEPWFNYYPPMIYSLAAVIHLLGFSLITSLNLLMFLSFLLAAWGMFRLVEAVTERSDLAFLGSTLLTLYPFHASNVFLRGVYAENLAWSLTPLILLVLYKQIMTRRFSRVLPFLFAGIFLTHIISAFLVTSLVCIWSLAVIGVKQKGQWMRSLTHLVLAGGIGIGLAAFFFIPALGEKNLVQSDSLIQGYYAYTNHFVGLKQLFVEYKWNYGASYWGEPPEEMSFMVGHVHTTLILFLILILMILFFRKRLDHKAVRGFLMLGGVTLLLACALLFMTHLKSAPIWALLPPLAYIQFPWRFVGWAGIPLVLTISLFLTLVPKKLSYLLTLVTLVCLLIYSYPFFFPREYDVYTDNDFIAGSLREEQQTKSLFDYLPSTVHQVPEMNAKDALFPISVFYFPGWYGAVGGKPIKLVPDPINGLITPENRAINPQEVVLTWRETPFRMAMDIVSGVTLLLYGLYLLKTYSHVQ